MAGAAAASASTAMVGIGGCRPQWMDDQDFLLEQVDGDILEEKSLDAVSDTASTELGSERESADGERSESQRFSQAETLIIFDWDDTLLPTSWLASAGHLLDEEAALLEVQQDALSHFSVKLADTLQTAKSLGTVVIITNAQEGWVESSCERFLPDVLPLLESFEIVSARSSFEPQGIMVPGQWKQLAFHEVVDGFFSQLSSRLHANIVSIGDSVLEHKALLSATAGRARCYAKSLKFCEKPSIEMLTEEHELVAGGLMEIAQHPEDLDVDVGGTFQNQADHPDEVQHGTDI